MQHMKKKLRKKISRHSTGIDEVTIAKIMTIPNEALVQLYQTCADELDAPQQWLVILLIGILKQGKPVDDPESYRLVSMEAGLLQM
jgi:hypothetical protein